MFKYNKIPFSYKLLAKNNSGIGLKKCCHHNGVTAMLK